MKKFGEIVKNKINESENRQENKIVEDFRIIYNSMLEHYGLTSVHDLDSQSQLSFLTELNHYWNEDTGLSEKGEVFLAKRSMALNENSTLVQKKNFLRAKSYAVINETLRQSDIKDRLYSVIDEMYKQLKASDVSDILSPNTITAIIHESFNKCLTELSTNINYELTESAKPKRKYKVEIKTR